MLSQAIWGLGNIAGDSPKTRDILLGHTGIVQAMCTQLNVNTKLSVLRNTVWVLSNFCRGKPPPSLALVKDIMLPLREFAEKNLSVS